MHSWRKNQTVPQPSADTQPASLAATAGDSMPKSERPTITTSAASFFFCHYTHSTWAICRRKPFLLLASTPNKQDADKIVTLLNRAYQL